ncbi:MAG: hypothetical protein NVSMB25_17820 [Thermoleophilaceae bacterium]
MANDSTITHHDLCFGCGIANLFGLQMEVEAIGEAAVAGRFFIKQDHQGPPGFAHGGIITSALDEAMALLVHGRGVHALTRRLEIDLLGPVPIGTFALVSARVESGEDRQLSLSAELTADGAPSTLARARGEFVRVG